MRAAEGWCLLGRRKGRALPVVGEGLRQRRLRRSKQLRAHGWVDGVERDTEVEPGGRPAPLTVTPSVVGSL